MKKSLWILGAAWVLSALASPHSFADTAINLAVITSDAQLDGQGRMIPFQLQVTVDGNDDLTGLTYYGGGGYHHFTIDQVRGGAVLKHDNGHNLDVLTLYAPGIDPRDGGPARLHYLINGVTGNSSNFELELHKIGTTWELYTGPDNGHRTIRSLFMKKNTFFGQTVGIDHIEAN